MPWPLPPYQLAADAADGELDPVNWPWRWSGAGASDPDRDDSTVPVYWVPSYVPAPRPGPGYAWGDPDPDGKWRVYGVLSDAGFYYPPAPAASVPHIDNGRLVVLAYQAEVRELWVTAPDGGIEPAYHWACDTPEGLWYKETFRHPFYGLTYRTELSSAVAPTQDHHGKTRPGYDISGGGAITFRLVPGVTDWQGENVNLSQWAAEMGNYGPDIELPKSNPVLRISMYSNDRFYDEATDTDHEGTGHTRWEITLRRGFATPSSPGSPEAPLLLDFGWSTGKRGSAEARAWNDSHHRGITNRGLEGEWDPEAHPWFRMRLPTPDTMTFEKSADGVTWMRLYSAAVRDYSMPFGEPWPGTEATRDGVMDIHPINNARVTVELQALGEPAAVSRFGGAGGDRYWRAEFDHFTIGGESVLLATRVVQDGAWVLASPRVAQDAEPPPWIHATPSVL